MLSIISFILFILLAVDAAGNHIAIRENTVSLPITRLLNYTHPHEILRKDHARVRHLLELCEAERNGTRTSNATKDDVVLYDLGDSCFVADVGIGEPPTLCGFH
jgi:hypothetical protein